MTRIRVLVTLALAALVGAAVPAIASAAVPKVPQSKFDVVENCGCHTAFLEQWRTTMHSKALVDPIYQLKLSEANRATNGALGPFCETCHGPVAAMAGLVGKKGKSRSGSAAEAVSCDFCHQLTGTAMPPGNFSWRIDANGVKRAQLKDALSPAHETAYSNYHEQAAFCGVCHNVNHPANGLPLEATYTEWSKSEYAKQGITCQDCHMTPGAGVTKPNPGRASGLGPERPHIYTMTWAGGNVGLGNAALAEERLKGAATLELEAQEIVEPGKKAEIAVTVVNSGAGHYLPTGLTDVRECWLQVTVTDAGGSKLVSERHDFNTVLADARGRFPAEVWDAVSVKSDTRIPPKGSKTFTSEYAMPQDGGVTVEAVLNYRSCSEKMAEEAGVKIPTTEMAKSVLAVFSSPEEAAAAEREAAARDGRNPDQGLKNLAIIAVIGLAALFGVIGVTVLRARRTARGK
ncbi:MAG: hypothetical protein C0418_00030 [Coriobacteriaceae bacterium]|nr:hypothetical protein [Coriobacteriaceae bacterium]